MRHGEPSHLKVHRVFYLGQALAISAYLECGFQTASRYCVQAGLALVTILPTVHRCNWSAFVAKCSDIALKDRLNVQFLQQHIRKRFLEYDVVDLAQGVSQ